MSANPTRKPRARKAAPAKPKKGEPSKEFPLGAASNGRWQKKVNGKLHYFGRWGRVVNGKLVRLPGDSWWTEALAIYKETIDDIRAGRKPRVKLVEGKVVPESDGLLVHELCDAFYTAKKRQLEAGELAARTFAEYDATGERLVKAFGRTRRVDDLGADDFEKLRAQIAKQWGPIRLGNEIQRVRTVFKYGFEAGLIDVPVRFGPQFVKPAKQVLRKHRREGGKRLFTPEEVRALLDGGTVTDDDGEEQTIPAASPQLRAMILLGINCGFGNYDCGTLPLAAVDLKRGWVAYDRPKTGIERRCPLWPETVAALKAAIESRPEPKQEADAGLVFITKYGGAWSSGGTSDAVTLETGKRLKKLHINGRKGLGFYSLRHTFRTVADATRDFPAVRLVMGHADGSIDDVYREHIEDARLVAVTEHVRSWLWPKPARKSRKGGAR